MQLLKKLKKSSYAKDNLLLKLVSVTEQKVKTDLQQWLTSLKREKLIGQLHKVLMVPSSLFMPMLET